MLEIRNLFSGYGRVEIIRDVSIDVEQGEVVSIIGRNGVGKYTFMKTIMGAVRPRLGSIVVDGIAVTNQPMYARADLGVGFVEQGHGIFPALTVEENLKVALTKKFKNHGSELDVAYGHFPILDARKTQKAGTLSGGEQAMLSIARALVSKPKLLILDEPSEGIQPNIVDQIAKIILECREELGLTILLVEQNLRLIQLTSDRAYAMDKGTIVGHLTRDELLDNDVVTSYLTV